MKKIILVVFLLFTSTYLLAQDTDDAVSLKKIADNIRGNPSKAIELSKRFEQLKKDTGDKIGIAQVKLYMGQAYRVAGEFDNARTSLLESLALIANENKPRLMCNIYISLGNTYSDLGEIDNVLPSYFKAQNIAVENDLSDLEITVAHNISIYKIYINRNREALQMLLEVRPKIVKNSDNRRVLTKNSSIQALAYSNLALPDSIMYHANFGIPYYKEKNDLFSLQDSYTFLARAHTMRNDYDEADRYFFKSDSILRQIDNQTIRSQNAYYWAQSLSKRGNYESAIEKLTSIIRGNFLGNPGEIPISDIYKQLAIAHKEVGNIQEASDNFAKYVDLQKKAESQSDVIQNDFFVKESEAFEKELADLKKSQQSKYRLLAIILICIVLGMAVFLFFHKRKKHIPTSKNTNPTAINQTIKLRILDGLEELEKNSFFLNTECSAATLAKQLNTNTSYLSKTIKEKKNKNFTQYINDLRMDYVIEKIASDSRFQNYSIESMARELGYKSTESFTKHFKKRTGLLPSTYLSNLLKKNHKDAL